MDSNDDEIAQIKRNLYETNRIGNEYINSVLIRFAIRWTITIILYTALWTIFPLIKWTLILVIPLGLFNLYQILYQKNKLEDRINEIESLIEEIEGENAEKTSVE